MCLIIVWWGLQNIVFESFNVQAGMDGSGVPTDMLTLNSSVKIFFRNPATFFGVHVTATPLQLHYYDLMLASGLVSHTPSLNSYSLCTILFYYLQSLALVPFFVSIQFQSVVVVSSV